MEPTLDQIEDYNGNESREKRNTVNLVIAGLFALGLVYASVKAYYNTYTLDIYTPNSQYNTSSK